jgi:3',5'-cyclic AMP phosphodiesterase CpdA
MTRWIHITDLQLGLGKAENDPNDELAVEMVRMVLAQRPDFVIHSGDCIHGTAIDHEAGENPEYLRMHLEHWEMYRQTLAPLLDHCPVFSVVGNHDHTFPDLDTELFSRYHGRDGKPAYSSETIAGVQVICLDVVPRRHHGGFPADTQQEAWLRDELARPTDACCRVVVGHYPIFMAPGIAHDVDPSLRYDEENDDPGRLLPMLLAADVDLYLCGHLHIYERARYENLTQVVAGANRIAYEGLLEMMSSRYLQIQDERQSYVEFKIVDGVIEATVVSLAGDRIDAWRQPLNRPGGSRHDMRRDARH